MRVAQWVAVLMMVCAWAGGTGQAVRPLGEFAAMKQDAEHCNGYAVDLWRSEGVVVGVFRACAGLVGDVPEGVIEEGSYVGGRVRFRARLSVGSDYVGGGKQVASKDVYGFEGRLVAGVLRGALTHVDEAEEKRAPETMRMAMRRQRVRLKGYGSLEAWRQEHAATPQ